MKNLILIRHAKALYDGFATDKERELAVTGIHRSIKVATESKDILNENFSFWSSTAERAMGTALVFSELFDIPFDTFHFTDALYTFDCTELKKVIQSVPNEISNLVVFGHNPAFTDFINQTTNLQIDNLPTSGLVSIEFDTDDWNDLPIGKVVKTLFAKDL